MKYVMVVDVLEGVESVIFADTMQELVDVSKKMIKDGLVPRTKIYKEACEVGVEEPKIQVKQL